MAIKARGWMVEVCKGLGFDPSMITKIVIELDARDKVTLKIEADAQHSAEVIKLLAETGQWANHLTMSDGETQHELDAVSFPVLEDVIRRFDESEVAQFRKLLKEQQEILEAGKRLAELAQAHNHEI